MNKGEMKRLGDYIREVDVRNRDLEVTIQLGLSMTKLFRPSTSNIVGVDLSKYKIVYPLTELIQCVFNSVNRLVINEVI